MLAAALEPEELARKGFEGAYLSGAAVVADAGLPDIGLMTLSEAASRAQQVTRATDPPLFVRQLDDAVARRDDPGAP